LWWLKILTGLPSLLSEGISAWSKHDQKKLDVDLEKYKVDGKVDEALVDASIKLGQAQINLNGNRDQYKGDRYLRYLFGYPTGLWYAAIVFDSIGQKIFNWKWDVLALPEPASTWAGWIVFGLFGISAIKHWTKK
jgi:hypothetical protein